MAEKRMFSKAIIDGDEFLDMSPTAQLLYFHLAMRADDDGFVNSPKKIMKFVGASVKDMDMLINQQFIIQFKSGIVVIKDWFIHNYIRKDRYKPTLFTTEREILCLDENGKYTKRSTNGQPNDNHLATQYSIDKNSIDKSSVDICSAPQKTKPTRHKYGEYKNVLLSDDELEKLKTEFPDDWNEKIERLSGYIASTGKTYKNHLATMRNWAKKDIEKGYVINEHDKRTVKSEKCKYGTTY